MSRDKTSTDRCVHGNLALNLPCIQVVLPVVHGNSSPAIVASFLTHEQHVRLVAVTCIAHSEFSHPHVTTAGSYMHSLVPHAQQLTFLWCARLTTEWLHYIVGICFVCCKPVHWVQCSKASQQLYTSPRQWEQCHFLDAQFTCKCMQAKHDWRSLMHRMSLVAA